MPFPPKLFRAGYGLTPPFLAGRGKMLKAMRQMADLLADAVVPASDVLLFGPRANGPFALLVDEAHISSASPNSMNRLDPSLWAPCSVTRRGLASLFL